METRFTPGPWTHYDDTSPAGKTGRHEIAAHGKTVARIYATRGAEIADAANAALIASAPALYEALEQCLRYIERDEVAHGRQFGDGNVARAALSLALSITGGGLG